MSRKLYFVSQLTADLGSRRRKIQAVFQVKKLWYLEVSDYIPRNLPPQVVSLRLWHVADGTDSTGARHVVQEPQVCPRSISVLGTLLKMEAVGLRPEPREGVQGSPSRREPPPVVQPDVFAVWLLWPLDNRRPVPALAGGVA